MQNSFSRRKLLGTALTAAGALPLYGIACGRARAASLPALDANDPTAKGLAFVSVSTTTGQRCDDCAQYQAATSGCNLFPGKSVPAGGWCKAWAKKPGT